VSHEVEAVDDVRAVPRAAYHCRKCRAPLYPGQDVYTSDRRPLGDPLKALFCSAKCGYDWDAVGVLR
jgi:RNase P subunit RPR2